MLEEFLKEWSYLAVFLLSALPWIESAAVVVLAIAFGLNPVTSTILAFAGNWLTVLLIVLLFDRWQQWRNKKRAADEGEKEENKKSKRAHNMLIGTEIAAAFAMIFKAPRKNVLIWMTVSLAFWTILFAAATHYGFNVFELI
jgi:Ca2+/H+ antiporter, TMEM165/GDT1 family